MQKHKTLIALLAATAVLYWLYIYDLSGNPPGFYIDETLAAFNAYSVSQSGRGEFGHLLPVYFPVLKIPPPHDYLGWADPVQIYALAALHLFFAPSYVLPRLLSATAMFVACLLLGRLAWRISGNLIVGVVTALTAMATPWLFEVGRLAFGASLYPCAIALLLTAVYSVYQKQRWPLANIVAVGSALGLVTYTYSIGRLLGPLLALGLIVFATDLERLKSVLKAWIAYAVTLVPLAVFHFRNPGALAGRFNTTVGILSPGKSYYEMATEFLANVAVNLSPYKMLFEGDPNLRHHMWGTGALYVPTLLLAIAGIGVVIGFHRKDAWWRYMLFGLAASLVPASLTRDPFHMLRLGAFPVFLITLTIPAVAWLAAAKNDEGETRPERPAPHFVGFRRGLLAALIAATIVQTVLFQLTFRRDGPTRGLWFDESYPRLVENALALPERPIYLVDGYWGQAYAHAYWYAIVHGIDRTNFVRVKQGERPPAGAIVISSEDKCLNCEMIRKDDPFLLYRERPPASPLK